MKQTKLKLILLLNKIRAPQIGGPKAPQQPRVLSEDEKQLFRCALTLKKSEQAIIACSDVVRLKGFEPPTYWFVASHSIQLSYSRI